MSADITPIQTSDTGVSASTMTSAPVAVEAPPEVPTDAATTEAPAPAVAAPTETSGEPDESQQQQVALASLTPEQQAQLDRNRAVLSSIGNDTLASSGQMLVRAAGDMGQPITQVYDLGDGVSEDSTGKGFVFAIATDTNTFEQLIGALKVILAAPQSPVSPIVMPNGAPAGSDAPRLIVP